ncbi:MAG: hypothetical protein ACPHDM_03650, partial [Candidatus Poseidoniaceae archaeon]
MAEDSRDKSERRLRVDQMPLAVKRLVDTMLGIDPNFEIEDWLIQKANEDLALIGLDIERERKQLEQRIHRLESLAKRLAPEDIREVPKGQTNLFDCFDIPLPLKHLTDRIEDITDEEQLKQIATISANNDKEVGELISTAMDKVGRDGVVTIEES